MSDLPYFKVWGQDALGSYDLQSLTDHEFRVFWSLMFIGSVQPKRWHIPYDLNYLLRASASTKNRFVPAVAELEARGMVAVLNGEIVMLNAPKWQETPEARRKRRQRERDKERDMSRQSHADVTGQVTPQVTSTRARNQKPDLLSEPKGSSSRGRAKRVTAITPEFLARMKAEFPDVDVDEELRNAEGHKKGLGSWNDKQQGFRNWLRRGQTFRVVRPNQQRQTGAPRISDGSDWDRAIAERDSLPPRWSAG